MVRRLPPLNAVRAFEAAARTGSIRAAADEQNVSQSAISRHVANLEAYLGAALFHRHGRRLLLSEAGREYLQQVETALDSIARASEHASRLRPRERLSISAPPSLTGNWILPRLHRFLEQNPDLDLRLLDRMTHPETEGEVDCAIEYRIDTSPRLKSEALLSDEIVPMAAPAYAARLSIDSLDSLQQATLIETERRLVSWTDVLSGRSWLGRQRMLTVSLSLHALEAARLGLGVALANRHNAKRFVQSSDLAIPFEIDQGLLPPRPRYWFSLSPGQTASEKALLFRDWLRQEIASES